VWTLDADTADIIDVTFHKSVIKSVAAMSYGAAQAIIDSPTDASPLAQVHLCILLLYMCPHTDATRVSHTNAIYLCLSRRTCG
jgi:exoribonuclease R